MNQHSKIKLFRNLKVVFYCLGVPLFFMAVLYMSFSFKANPFSGEYTGPAIMASVLAPLGSTFMYGVYVALAIWVVIAVIQLILRFTVKNRKARMIGGVAAVLVCMLVPVFVMDAVFTSNINALAASAPNGVVVKSYKEQLSYYRSFTSEGNVYGKVGNKTRELEDYVANLLEYYHIDYSAASKDGSAGNVANNPIYYDDLGIDFNKDGAINKYDHILIQLKPQGVELDKDGGVVKGDKGTPYFEIDGKRYDGYFVSSRWVIDHNMYVWYSLAKMPTVKDGLFGEASYNANGLLSDGYVFGLNSALKVLEVYYSSQEEINKCLKVLGGGKTWDSELTQIQADARVRKEQYYNSSEELKAIWESEAKLASRHSLTVGELDNLVSLLMGALGSNELFRFIFEDVLGSAGLAEQLEKGYRLTDLLDMIFGLLGDTLGGLGGIIDSVIGGLGIDEMTLILKYTETDPEHFPGQKFPVLGLGGSDKDGKPVDVQIAIDEHFNLNELDGLLDALGVGDLLPTLLGLLGLSISGEYTGIKSILTNLLDGMYWYLSPILRTDYSFYVDETLPEYDYSLPMSENSAGAVERRMQEEYAKYQISYYEGSKHGTIIGSVLIGDNIGDGSFPAAKGLTSLQAVQQLQMDLSYIPTYYPLFSVRDMLMTFVGIAMFFTILSYVCAEKEIEWATGKGRAKVKRGKKGKKGDKKGNNKDNIINPDYKDKANAETLNMAGSNYSAPNGAQNATFAASPNGHQVPPNGYQNSPNGHQVPPNGYQNSPNAYPIPPSSAATASNVGGNNGKEVK